MTNNRAHGEVMQDCLKLIENCSDIDGRDRALLLEIVERYDLSLISNLSFVSDESAIKELDGYTVEFGENGPYRILSGRHWGPGRAGAALDRAGAFLAQSNHVFHHPYALVKSLPILMEARAWALEVPSFPLGADVVYAERWPSSYGHLIDEMFTTAAAIDAVSDLAGYVPLIDYALIGKGSGGTALRNAAQMAQAIYQGGALNLSAFVDPSISVSRVALIRNRVADACFHRFPAGVSERVIAYFDAPAEEPHEPGGQEFIFLTRSLSADPRRRIPHLEGMIAEARARGFRVIDPEKTPLQDLVPAMQAARGVVCTWGGSLTNMAFTQPDTKVGILKLPAYRGESLDFIFRNLLEEHPMVTTVLDVDDITAGLPEFTRLLDWLRGL